MRLFFITSKLNFETAGGSVEEFDLMMRTWQQCGADVTAVTVFSNDNRIPHTLPYALKEEHLEGAGRLGMQTGIYRLLKKYEQDADIFHVDGQMFLYGAGAYRRLGGRVPVQAYFNRELTCWEPLLSTLFPDARHHETLVERTKRSIWWTIERLIGMPFANGIDHRIYVCPQFQKTYQDFGMSPEGSVIVDPVDVAAIRQEYGVTETSYQERNKTEGPLTIFYSGRMVPGKGYDVLLEAFARVRNKEQFRLVLGGGGPEESCIRAAIKRLQLEPYVELPGWTPLDDVYRRMTQADIGIQPDWIPYGTSIALIKSMAFGLPCIVPAGGGLAWVAGEGALTFPRRDVDALARLIERLGSDRDLRATLSAGCATRLRSPDFDYTTLLTRTFEVMKQLVDQKSHAR